MSAIPKQTIRVFLSSADTDNAAARDLWDRLEERLRNSKNFEWIPWSFDRRLIIGEDFDTEIQEAIGAADLGLFALSPAFLNSAYIRHSELPRFLHPADGKLCAPLMLKALPTDADLGGLEARQIFGFHDPYYSGRPLHKRDEWATQLADELHRLARKYELGQG